MIMAKKEAFCTQCGSLIQVDDSKETGKCIFCGADVSTAKAIDLKADPDTRIALQASAQEKAKEEAKLNKELQKTKGSSSKSKSNAPEVPTTREITVIEPLPMKTKLIILVSVVAVIAILSGILIPMILTRNNHRTSFDSQINKAMPFTIASHAYKFSDNRELVIATKEVLSSDKAKEAFTSYQKLYEKAYSVSADKATSKLVVKLYAKEGLYVCKYVNNEFQSVFERSDPTPTPKPTTAIVAK
jgi:hypothetical protein